MKSKVFLSVGVLCALVLFVSWTLPAEAAKDIPKGEEVNPAAEAKYYNGGGYNHGGGYNGGGGYNHGGGGGYNHGGGGGHCYHGYCHGHCCSSAEEAQDFAQKTAKP